MVEELEQRLKRLETVVLCNNTCVISSNNAFAKLVECVFSVFGAINPGLKPVKERRGSLMKGEGASTTVFTLVIKTMFGCQITGRAGGIHILTSTVKSTFLHFRQSTNFNAF